MLIRINQNILYNYITKIYDKSDIRIISNYLKNNLDNFNKIIENY